MRRAHRRRFRHHQRQGRQLGDKAEFGKDAIKVNGKLLQAVEDKVYLAFYKPRAVISMLVDNENRPNLSDYLSKVRTRVFPIGRLDFNSEGLILLTNDGDFAEKLQKRDDIPRVYTIKVKGQVDAEAIRRLEKGARIDYRMVRPHSVRKLRELDNKTQLQIVIVGGGAVDIRALCEMKGLLVDKITRTAIGHITLKGLVPGHLRYLKPSQAEALVEQPELGLQLLEREIEDDKPKGQRNFHPKKAQGRPPSSRCARPRPSPWPSRAEAPRRAAPCARQRPNPRPNRVLAPTSARTKRMRVALRAATASSNPIAAERRNWTAPNLTILAMALISSSGHSFCGRWPHCGISSQIEPGISALNSSPSETGVIPSSLPQTSSVGLRSAVILPSR